MTAWRSRDNITPQQQPAWHPVRKGGRRPISPMKPLSGILRFSDRRWNASGQIPRHERAQTAKGKNRFSTVETLQMAGVLPRAPSRQGAGGQTREHRGNPALERNAFSNRILLFCSLLVPFDWHQAMARIAEVRIRNPHSELVQLRRMAQGRDCAPASSQSARGVWRHPGRKGPGKHRGGPRLALQVPW